MWGDTPGVPAAQFGHNTYVFKGNSVGNQNYVENFHQQLDKIEFSQVTGVHNFRDLGISTNGSGDTVITTPHDSVVLVGFSGTLTSHDFIIA